MMTLHIIILSLTTLAAIAVSLVTPSDCGLEFPACQWSTCYKTLDAAAKRLKPRGKQPWQQQPASDLLRFCTAGPAGHNDWPVFQPDQARIKAECAASTDGGPEFPELEQACDCVVRSWSSFFRYHECETDHCYQQLEFNHPSHGGLEKFCADVSVHGMEQVKKEMRMRSNRSWDEQWTSETYNCKNDEAVADACRCVYHQILQDQANQHVDDYSAIQV
ncbi:hypothetical protein XA68_10496 [Ophiocordyceps unilateralis]|uniref:Extracellular membrane protein CFEM domain-containing protein n=1 Tax=Ophiocordyceps unilateralis TaxID=268505 RepID=A0A2A9NZR8_OPHUN|nr:hypothetical protein XA68_10496 [Ophiocordyceps unilateralis]